MSASARDVRHVWVSGPRWETGKYFVMSDIGAEGHPDWIGSLRDVSFSHTMLIECLVLGSSYP